MFRLRSDQLKLIKLLAFLCVGCLIVINLISLFGTNESQRSIEISQKEEEEYPPFMNEIILNKSPEKASNNEPKSANPQRQTSDNARNTLRNEPQVLSEELQAQSEELEDIKSEEEESSEELEDIKSEEEESSEELGDIKSEEEESSEELQSSSDEVRAFNKELQAEIIRKSFKNEVQVARPVMPVANRVQAAGGLFKCTGPGCDPSRDVLVPVKSLPVHQPYQLNMKSKVMRNPWKRDPMCSQHRVRPGINIPIVHLVSYPRSGNTFLRTLTEGATGFLSGSVYRDSTLYELGFLGEMEPATDGSVLLLKNHQFRPRITNDLQPVVLLLRDPIDLFISLYTFKYGPILEAAPIRNAKGFESKEFHLRFDGRLFGWFKMALLMIQKCKYLHVIYFEELAANPISEIRKMLAFLQITVDEDRMACLAKNLDENANIKEKRPKIYTVEEEQSIVVTVNRLSKLLQDRGFGPLPYADDGY